MRHIEKGFTLIELMITVMIIGVLLAIAIPRFQTLVRKSKEGATKGSLSSLRSALSIYFSANEQNFPVGGLDTLSTDGVFIDKMPIISLPPYHTENTLDTSEVDPTDTGGWSYNNDSTLPSWGEVHVGCTHEDLLDQVWSSL